MAWVLCGKTVFKDEVIKSDVKKGAGNDGWCVAFGVVRFGVVGRDGGCGGGDSSAAACPVEIKSGRDKRCQGGVVGIPLGDGL